MFSTHPPHPHSVMLLIPSARTSLLSQMHCFLDFVFFVHVWLPTQSGHSSWHLHKCPALNKCGSGWHGRTYITWPAILVALLDYSANSCVIILYEMEPWLSVHGSELRKPTMTLAHPWQVEQGLDCLKIQISNPISLSGSLLLLRKGPIGPQKKENGDMSSPCPTHICICVSSISPPCPVCTCRYMFRMCAHACGCQKTTLALILPFPHFCSKQGISLAWNFTKRARLGELLG